MPQRFFVSQSLKANRQLQNAYIRIMKAIICTAYGPPENLEFGDLPDPVPGDDEVVIRVKACSVNFPDTLIIQGLYQFKPDFPFSPGADVAGIVESVGANVKHVKPGDEVLGMDMYGGFAEKMLVKKHMCFPKPAGMTMIEAASFVLAYGTSYYALQDRGKLKAGDSLLVLGASGGVGLAAVELGKLLGAKVIAAASNDEKLALCKSYGADELINYSTENLKDRVKEITNKKGVDVIFDPVGSDYTETALRSIAWGGRHLVVGFAAGSIPKMPLNLVLLKSCQIVGVFYGAFAINEGRKNMERLNELVDWFQEKKLNPHVDGVYELRDVPKALRAIMDRTVKGKLVVRV